MVVLDDATLMQGSGRRRRAGGVTVTNLNGSASLPNAYRYHAAPTLSAVAPARGPAAGGTNVTLTGSGFLADGAAPDTVTFGAALATNVVVVDDTRITCKAPAGAPGALVSVAVANKNGRATLPGAYRYNPVPTLTSFTPTSGSPLGGTTVTLNGSGFSTNSAGTNIVLFGGRWPRGPVVNDGKLTCVAPAGPRAPRWS